MSLLILSSIAFHTLICRSGRDPEKEQVVLSAEGSTKRQMHFLLDDEEDGHNLAWNASFAPTAVKKAEHINAADDMKLAHAGQLATFPQYVPADSDADWNASALLQGTGVRDADQQASTRIVAESCIRDSVRALYDAIGLHKPPNAGDPTRSALTQMIKETRTASMAADQMKITEEIRTLEVSIKTLEKAEHDERRPVAMSKELRKVAANLARKLALVDEFLRVSGFDVEVAKDSCSSDKYIDQSILKCVQGKAPMRDPVWAKHVWQLRILKDHMEPFGSHFRRSQFTIAVRDSKGYDPLGTNYASYENFRKQIDHLLTKTERPIGKEEEEEGFIGKVKAKFGHHKTEFDDLSRICRDEQFQELHNVMEMLRAEITTPSLTTPSLKSSGCNEASDHACPEGTAPMTITETHFQRGMKAFVATEAVVHPLVAFTNVVLLPISGFVVGGALGAMGGPVGAAVGAVSGFAKAAAWGAFFEFFFPVSSITSSLVGLWQSLPDIDCACHPRICEYTQSQEACSLNANHTSRNPYSAVLPFPGFKCKHSNLDNRDVCVEVPCEQNDFEGGEEAKYGSYSGKLGLIKGGKSLYNCLNIDHSKNPHGSKWLGKYAWASPTLADGNANNVENRKAMYDKLPGWNNPLHSPSSLSEVSKLGTVSDKSGESLKNASGAVSN